MLDWMLRQPAHGFFSIPQDCFSQGHDMLGYHAHAHVTLHGEKGVLCSAIKFTDLGYAERGDCSNCPVLSTWTLSKQRVAASQRNCEGERDLIRGSSPLLSDQAPKQKAQGHSVVSPTGTPRLYDFSVILTCYSSFHKMCIYCDFKVILIRSHNNITSKMYGNVTSIILASKNSKHCLLHPVTTI